MSVQTWLDKQQLIWQRMKADTDPNSPGYNAYQQIIFDTTWDRYADMGRWEMLRALINNDPEWGKKSIAELATNLQDFTLLYAGNEAREMAAEIAGMYPILKPWATPDQDAKYQAWLIRVADHIVAGHRIGDSDSNVGEGLALPMIDQVLGTTYAAGSFRNVNTGKPQPVSDLITVIRDKYTTRMAKGGIWIEPGEYNYGTLYLYFQAAYWLGLEKFPELIPFIKAHAIGLMHHLTPGLQDSWQFGDEEHPHEISLFYALGDIWSITQYLLDEIGEPDLAAMLRQHEADCYAANNHTLNPLLARYYYWANPYGAKKEWRTVAGNFHVAEGTGHVKWRTGTELRHKGTHIHFPGFSLGAVDHFEGYGFGSLRLINNGVFVQDNPLCYGPDARYHNQVLVCANQGPSLEATGLTHWDFKDGVFAYASGTTAGCLQMAYNGAYGTLPTTMHENNRQVFELLDQSSTIILVLDRVHATDPRDLVIDNQYGHFEWKQLFTYAYMQDLINVIPDVKQWNWHLPVKPEVTDKGFRGALNTRWEIVYSTGPMKIAVVDEKTDTSLTGYIYPEQQKWVARVTPLEKRPFDIVITAITNDPTVTFQAVTDGDLIGARIIRPDRRPVTFLASSFIGPVLETTYEGPDIPVIKHDPTKLTRVVSARRRLVRSLDIPGDVYVADMGTSDKLVQFHNPVSGVPVPVPAPEPTPTPTPTPTPGETEYETKIIRKTTTTTATAWDKELAPYINNGWEMIGFSSGTAVLRRPKLVLLG